MRRVDQMWKVAIQSSFQFALLLSAAAAAAQENTINIPAVNINQVATPQPGSGHDYIKFLNETVNPANGAVSVRVEAPVPKQRGDVTFPYYVFSYDSTGVMVPTAQVTFRTPTQQDAQVNWNDSTQTRGGLVEGTSIGAGYGPVPGGFVVNSGVGGLFDQDVTLNVPFTDSTGGVNGEATCEFLTGFTYIDPEGGSHSFPIQFIKASAPGNPANNGGCSPFSSLRSFNVGNALDDNAYQMMLSGQPCDPGSVNCTQEPTGTYLTDAHGRGPAGLTTVDTNGNSYSSPAGTPTVVYNNSLSQYVVTSLPIHGLTNPYTYTYGTATQNYSFNMETTQDTPYVGGCGPVGKHLSTTLNSSVFGATKTTVTGIGIPDGTAYKFDYINNIYGLLDQITYPTGATVTYQWALDLLHESYGWGILSSYGTYSMQCAWEHDQPKIVTRTVSFDGTTPALQQSFQYQTSGMGPNSPQWASKTTTVTTKDLLRTGQPSFNTTYTYVSFPQSDFTTGAFEGQTAVEREIDYYDWTTAQGTYPLLKTVTKNWLTPPFPGNTQPLLASECTTVQNVGTAGVFYRYSYLGVVVEKQEYDYGTIPSNACDQTGSYNFPAPTPTRDTMYNLHNFAPTGLFPGSSSILDRPDSIQVYGNGTLLSDTEVTYDAYGSSGLAPVTAGGSFDAPSFTNRGNATAVKRCVIGQMSSCVGPTTTYAFDATGQIIAVTDPCGNAPCPDMQMPAGSTHTTQYSYADKGTNLPSQNSNAYLTKITNPLGQIENFTYDYNSGQLTGAQDQNDINASNRPGTTYTYNDLWARLRQVTHPDGGQTEYTYFDSGTGSTDSTVTTCLLMSGTQGANCSPTSPPAGYKTSVASMDGMGHVVQTQLFAGSGTANAITTTTTYDGLGNVASVGNPNVGTTLPTNGTTLFSYDSLSRKVLQTNQDSSTLQWCYDDLADAGQTNCHAQLSSAVGEFVDADDENRNDWQRTTNALGQLVSVMEPNGTSKTPPSMETDYSYDALNNLSLVRQWGGAYAASGGEVNRSFTYDTGLGRLLSAANPETGLVSYSYDANGNVSSKIDARNVKTSYSYDPLNRLLGKSYSDPSTLASCYQYDTAPNGVGRLGFEWTQSSCPVSPPSSPPTSGYQSKRVIGAYDAMGRVTAEQQCVLGYCTSASVPAAPSANCTSVSGASGLTYCYDQAGNPTAYANGFSTGPSAVSFAQSFDAAGRLQGITSTLQGITGTLFSAQSFWPHGPWQSAVYGAVGGNGVTLGRTYDSRLRINSESDSGQTVTTQTPGSTTVAISGEEQSQ